MSKLRRLVGRIAGGSRQRPRKKDRSLGSEGTYWESFITLNSAVEPVFDTLPSASEFYERARDRRLEGLDLGEAVRQDPFPLPMTKDREGYFGSNHFEYWLSGLKDARNLLAAAAAHGRPVKAYLDFGCASGRVLRHMALQNTGCSAMGCDINRFHVEWCNQFLPTSCLAFQNHSIPTLPLADSSFDLVSAFSVFTHVEALETAWLMELRRILRPGGLAWVTVHTEQTLSEMTEEWPLWKPTHKHPVGRRLLESGREFPGAMLVLRWKGDRSYSSNVFYRLDYLRSRWGRIFEIAEVKRRFPAFQDVLILRKPVLS